MKNIAVILAGGSGFRFQSSLPKQFIKLGGKTVIEHTIDVFEKNTSVDEIIVVVNSSYRELFNNLLLHNHYTKIRSVLNGGTTRLESARIALAGIQDEDKVLLHDAVRPFLSDRIINDCFLALDQYEAVDVAIPSTDTIIQVDECSFIQKIPERKFFWRGQTPQAFKAGILKQAQDLAMKSGDTSFTDDCGLIKKYDIAPIYVVRGEEKNIKITHKEDIYTADKLFQVNMSEIISTKSNLNKLYDKTLVIFGASSGIGRSIAEIAQNYKMRVYTTSRTSGCDITDKNSISHFLKSVYQETLRIDYIINTAAIMKVKPFNNMPQQDIQEQINTNYLGSLYLLQESHPYLKESKGELLLFSSSSYTRGRAGYAVYSSTKAALVNLVQAISEEWFYDGIRINVIVPERTATPMRLQNFGVEPEQTLLSTEFVAQKTVEALLSVSTGQIFEIRKLDERKISNHE